MKVKTETKAALTHLALITLLAITVYWNSLHGKFIWDDRGLIKNNIYIAQQSNISVFFTHDMNVGSDSSGQSNYYRPLQMLTNKIDYIFWGLNPFGYHLTNLFFHILAAFMVFWFVETLFTNRMVSCVTSLLFVLHPVHVEAVSYIAGRSDPLVTFFMLLSLTLYAKYILRYRRSLYIFSLLAFIFALLSKENSVILPFLIILVGYVYGRKPTLQRLLPFFGLLIGFMFLRHFVVHPLYPQVASFAEVLQRVPGFLRSIAKYFQILLFPLRLHLEYDNILFKIRDPLVITGIFSSVFLIGLAWFKRKNTLLAFSILWFFLGLIPVSNILKTGYPYMMEHWCYSSSIGFFIIISYGAFLMCKAKLLKMVAIAMLAALAAFYSYTTIMQNKQWRDPITLFTTALRYAPDNPMLNKVLGDEYLVVGDKEKAIACYKRVAELRPDFIGSYISIGNEYYKAKDSQEAKLWYLKAARLFPGSPKPYIGLANILVQTGRLKEAVGLYEKAIGMDPGSAYVYCNLGFIYAKIGQVGKAIGMFDKALEIDPDSLKAYQGLSHIYQIKRETDKLHALYTKAIARKLAYFDAYYNIANSYSEKGEYKKAIALYKKAIKINPGVGQGYFSLGRAYFAVKKDKESVECFRKVITLDPKLAMAYGFIAISYASQGKYSLAVSYCDKALEYGYRIDPQLLEFLKPYR